MRKVSTVILFLLFISISINSEKWVGQAATYQLLDGSRTANGEMFKRDSVSAACNGFKFGAEVVVTNAQNGRQVKVKINDRIINSGSDYFLLLSPQAAKELGMEWETGIVVVDAKFSDVNSNERLEIKGLVPEGEIDLESIRRFPEVVWPEVDETVSHIAVEEYDGVVYPEEDHELEIPLKETRTEKMDIDSGGFYQPVEKEILFPETEKAKIPEKEKIETKIDDYNGVVETVKNTPPLEKRSYPDKFAKVAEMNKDVDEFLKPKIEKIKAIEKIDVVKLPEKETIEWKNKLDPGIYIRFSTTFNKAEGDRRMMLFGKVFNDVIGLKSRGRYILFVGPVPEDNIDIAIKKIRAFGYKDAYIVEK